MTKAKKKRAKREDINTAAARIVGQATGDRRAGPKKKRGRKS